MAINHCPQSGNPSNGWATPDSVWSGIWVVTSERQVLSVVDGLRGQVLDPRWC